MSGLKPITFTTAEHKLSMPGYTALHYKNLSLVPLWAFIMSPLHYTVFQLPMLPATYHREGLRCRPALLCSSSHIRHSWLYLCSDRRIQQWYRRAGGCPTAGDDDGAKRAHHQSRGSRSSHRGRERYRMYSCSSNSCSWRHHLHSCGHSGICRFCHNQGPNLPEHLQDGEIDNKHNYTVRRVRRRRRLATRIRSDMGMCPYQHAADEQQQQQLTARIQTYTNTKYDALAARRNNGARVVGSSERTLRSQDHRFQRGERTWRRL